MQHDCDNSANIKKKHTVVVKKLIVRIMISILVKVIKLGVIITKYK